MTTRSPAASPASDLDKGAVLDAQREVPFLKRLARDLHEGHCPGVFLHERRDRHRQRLGHLGRFHVDGERHADPQVPVRVGHLIHQGHRARFGVDRGSERHQPPCASLTEERHKGAWGGRGFVGGSVGRPEARQVGLGKLRFDQDGVGIQDGEHGSIGLHMFPDGGMDRHNDTGNGGVEGHGRDPTPLLERPWALGELLLRLVIGFFEGLRRRQVGLGFALGPLGLLQLPGGFGVLLAECLYAAQGLLGLGEGRPSADGVCLSGGRAHRHFDFQGLNLLLGVQIREQLAADQVGLHHGQHLARLHACAKRRQRAIGWESELPCRGRGHCGFVARAHGDHARQPQPLRERPAGHGLRLGQEFPLLLFEKADAVRRGGLWGVFRLLLGRRRRSMGAASRHTPGRPQECGGRHATPLGWET